MSITASKRATPFVRTTRAVGAIAVALALAACSGGPTPAPPPGGLEPQAGGSIDFAVGPGLTCVDPAQGVSAEHFGVAKAITDTLTDADPINGEIHPWLAESWEVSPDATEYIFYLRDDVTFSDGSSFNAEVVKANLDALVERADLAGQRSSSYVVGLAATEVIDEFTVSVRFAAPTASFLVNSSSPALGIVSLATTQLTAEERCQGGVVGTGPFVLDSYTSGEGAVLLKREDYDWASPLASHQGPAYLDSVHLQVIAVPSVRMGALTSGQVSLALGVAPQDVPVLEAADASIVTRVQPGIPASAMVNASADRIVADPVVRQALQVAIDRPALTAAIFGEVFQPATSVFSSSMYGRVDLSVRLAQDLDLAAELLDKGGWELGADGIRERDGERLELSILYTEDFGAFYTPMLSLLQDGLRDIGIAVILNDQPLANFVTASTGLDYDLMVTSLTESDPDLIRLLAAPRLAVAPEFAETGLPELLHAQASTPNGPDRLALLEDVQVSLIDTAFVIPLFEVSQILGVASGVHGAGFDFQSRFVLYDAWIEP